MKLVSDSVKQPIDGVKNSLPIIFGEKIEDLVRRRYKDNETYTSVNHETKEETKFTGQQYRELFMDWFNKIKPYLDNNDESGVLNVLIDWSEETLAKSDMYSMVRRHFKELRG